MIKTSIKKWVLFAFAGILLYILLGMMVPFLNRKEVSREYQKNFDVSKYYGQGESADRAMIVESSMDALDERLRMIEMAKSRIILTTFDMRPGQSTDDVLSALFAAADRGVQIQVLVDGISGFLRMEGNDACYALSSYPGIEVRIYNPVQILKPWTYHGRMHDKYLIVDDSCYLLGGRNTFDYFLGDYIEDDKSLDREVFILNTGEKGEDSSLFQLEAYFQTVWEGEWTSVFHKDPKLAKEQGVQDYLQFAKAHYQEMKKEKPDLFAGDEMAFYEKATVPASKVTLISGPVTIYGKEPVVWYELEQLMLQAKERVWIHTPYAVLDQPMYRGMEEISSKGIEFTMLLNSRENGDNFMASSDYGYHKGDILDTGVQLYEYDGGDSYHGKSILIDDRISVIGSYNLDLRSTYVDTELMLVVDSRELNEELEACMLNLQEDSRKVLDRTEYEVPEGITVQEIPAWKRIAMWMVGAIMHLFRVLV